MPREIITLQLGQCGNQTYLSLVMSSVDTVLIAADGSDTAKAAFTWYGEKLHRAGNKVVIVSALEMASVPTRESWDELMAAGDKKKAELEDKYLQQLKDAGMTGTFIADHEKPGQYLCRAAKEQKADFIVMGSRGLGSVRRTIMGSVSDYVVHHAHCPVLIYKTKD